MVYGKQRKLLALLGMAMLTIGTGVSVFLVHGSREDNHLASSGNIAVEKPRGAAGRVVDTNSVRYGAPVRLTISSIDVDATIQPVGLTLAGDMKSPDTNERVGWYKYGARPGNVGSAVIAGHFGLNGDAVFGRLKSLKKGDIISIVDDREQRASFIVRRTHIYNYDAAPSEVFTSTRGAHLNLISCDGDWDAARGTYTERLVVFTDKL